jgi:hypothetical protein
MWGSGMVNVEDGAGSAPNPFLLLFFPTFLVLPPVSGTMLGTVGSGIDIVPIAGVLVVAGGTMLGTVGSGIVTPPAGVIPELVPALDPALDPTLGMILGTVGSGIENPPAPPSGPVPMDPVPGVCLDVAGVLVPVLPAVGARGTPGYSGTLGSGIDTGAPPPRDDGGLTGGATILGTPGSGIPAPALL